MTEEEYRKWMEPTNPDPAPFVGYYHGGTDQTWNGTEWVCLDKTLDSNWKREYYDDIRAERIAKKATSYLPMHLQDSEQSQAIINAVSLAMEEQFWSLIKIIERDSK